MTDVIIMSILPKYAEMIFAGDKRWEYRKKAPAQIRTPYTVIVYVSRDQYIGGEMTVGKVLTDRPGQVIIDTVDETPHDEMDLWEYFGNAYTGHAMRIDDVTEYDRKIPKDELPDLLGGWYSPQTFTYSDEEQLDLIRRAGNRRLLEP